MVKEMKEFKISFITLKANPYKALPPFSERDERELSNFKS